MPPKPYEDKNLLYELYVKKRMTMTDIQKYFENKYDCVVTGQTIYNWLKKYELLQFRGKGKKTVKKTVPLSPMAKQALAQQKLKKKQMKERYKSRGV